MSSTLVNTLGLALPFILLGSTLPLTLMASLQYDEGLSNYFSFDATLAEAQENWRRGDATDPDILSSASSLLFKSLSDFRNTATWFKRTYWCLTAWCGAFTLGFIVVGALYARALRKTINELSSRSTESIGFQAFNKTRKWLLKISFMFVITMGEFRFLSFSIAKQKLTRFGT